MHPPKKVSGFGFGGGGASRFDILKCQSGAYGLSSLPFSPTPELEPSQEIRYSGEV
jgi:hypothetical protein